MELKKLTESVVLLGPKAVGKSLIASKLASRFEGYDIFSSDKLENYAMLFYQGNFRSVDEVKSVVKDEFSDKRALKKYSGDPEEIVKRNQEYLKDYLDSLDFYSKIVDFKKLRQIVNETINILSKNTNFSLRQQLFVMQYQKIKMLEAALENIEGKLIFDFGADIGSVIDLSDRERKMISSVYNKPFNSISKQQEKLFGRFGMVIYLEPGIDYKEKVDPRSNDLHNKIYSENKNSYVSFSDLVVTMNGTFNDPANEVFKNDNDFDAGAFSKKQKLLNKGNIDNICDLIAAELLEAKQM